jgi:hypothetical protein
MQIREKGLDLKSAIDLVVRGTQEITRSCGVAVGLLHVRNAFSGESLHEVYAFVTACR